MLNINLENKVALVTGASGELGRVMARTLAAAGADIGVHFHQNEAKAREVCDEIAAMGRRAIIIQADITLQNDVLRMRDTIAEQIGAPDIIVNNAVSRYEWKSILDQAPEDYEGQYRSSVLHNVLMAQAFVPAMIEKKWGRVIAISTECAMQCGPSQSAYVSGKRGMDGILRVLAREVGENNITVNQVAPGWMISDASRKEGSESQPGYEANVPLRRRGTDQDIANAVAFLASDLAGFISGAWLPVCGGDVMSTI